MVFLRRTTNLLALVLFFAACGDDDTPAEDAGVRDAVSDRSVEDTALPFDTSPPSCSAPESVCGIQCVDTSSDPNNCGGCGRSCVIPNASSECNAGACAVGACSAGFFDANDDPSDGCESTTGGCTAGGTCATACGSEGSLVCEGGEATCATPEETCNLVDDDCDGACDQGLTSCRVGVHRARAGGGHLYTRDLAEAMGGVLERENYYYLYAEPAPGAMAFRRCQKGNGLWLSTTSADCEGSTEQGILGYIATTEICGSRPLFRLFKDGNHFYTTNATERDNAVNNLGFTFERIAGYVW